MSTFSHDNDGETNSANKPLPRAVFWVVWFALSQSVVIYFLVLKFSGRDNADMAATVPESLRVIFLGVAVVAVLVSFVIRFLITSKGGPKALPSYIVSLALAELPAILGLLLGFLGFPIGELYYFFGFGLLSLLVQPPTVLPK